MKTIILRNAILHVSESKAVCHFCERPISFDEIDEKLNKSKTGFFRHRCLGCKRFVGITSNIMGDIVSYEL